MKVEALEAVARAQLLPMGLYSKAASLIGAR